MVPRLELFQQVPQLIDSIRGIEEAEQIERDRNLQNTIAIVGVGLGAAAIGSAAAPYVFPTEPLQPILPPFSTSHLHPFTQSLLLSLFFGVAGAVVTRGFIYLLQNRGTIAARVTKLIQGNNKLKRDNSN